MEVTPIDLTCFAQAGKHLRENALVVVDDLKAGDHEKVIADAKSMITQFQSEGQVCLNENRAFNSADVECLVDTGISVSQDILEAFNDF